MAIRGQASACPLFFELRAGLAEMTPKKGRSTGKTCSQIEQARCSPVSQVPPEKFQPAALAIGCLGGTVPRTRDR